MCDILFMHHVGFSSTNILYSKFNIWAWQHTKAKVRCVRMGCLHVQLHTINLLHLFDIQIILVHVCICFMHIVVDTLY